jgi:hypothetical protein
MPSAVPTGVCRSTGDPLRGMRFLSSAKRIRRPRDFSKSRNRLLILRLGPVVIRQEPVQDETTDKAAGGKKNAH